MAKKKEMNEKLKELEEMKDRKIDEDLLDDVAGGFGDGSGIQVGDAKEYAGGLKKLR